MRRFSDTDSEDRAVNEQVVDVSHCQIYCNNIHVAKFLETSQPQGGKFMHFNYNQFYIKCHLNHSTSVIQSFKQKYVG